MTARDRSEPWNPAFGRLFDQEALDARGLSKNQIAARAKLTGAGWARIAKGMETKGGQVIPAAGPASTVARMANALGITPDQLREVDHPQAARALELMREVEAQQASERSSRERLIRIRAELDEVIAELGREP